MWLWLQPQPFFVNVEIWGGGALLDSWGSSLRKGATRKRRNSGAIGGIADPGLRRFAPLPGNPVGKSWRCLELFLGGLWVTRRSVKGVAGGNFRFLI